jgi:CDP-diacylglycerol--glycerol-3-phosphate 3-phosphatidyltransferase
MQVEKKDFLKIPNLISLSRIVLLAPFLGFFYAENFALTFASMILIFLSDVLDGWSSRKFNQITELGKVLDPIADKIVIGIGMIVILLKANAPLWPVYVLIGRDVFILFFGIILSKRTEEVPASNIFGKLTSFFFGLAGMAFVALIFFPSEFLKKASYALYYAAFTFTVASSISYFIKGMRLWKGR